MMSKPKNTPPGTWAAALLAALLAGCQAGGGAGQPLAASVRKQPWSFSGLDGTELATQHYRIYTTTDNRAVLTYLPGFMENAHANYLALTGLSAPPGGRPMPIYMLADRPQWAAMTEKVTAPQQKLYLAVENGGYCYRGVCIFWDMGHFATFSIAAHEGLHQFLHHRLKNHIPAWAEEGLAVQAEGFKMTPTAVRFDPAGNTLRLVSLRNLISAGRWLALEKLLSTDAGDHVSGMSPAGPEYYAQLWALLMFIRSRPAYRAGLERMLADAAAGRLRKALGVPPIMGRGRAYNRAISVPAFQQYVDRHPAAFDRDFRAYARKLARLD